MAVEALSAKRARVESEIKRLSAIENPTRRDRHALRAAVNQRWILEAERQRRRAGRAKSERRHMRRQKAVRARAAKVPSLEDIRAALSSAVPLFELRALAARARAAGPAGKDTVAEIDRLVSIFKKQ